MMKRLFAAFAAIILACAAAYAQYPSPYLSAEKAPDGVRLLPPPPARGSWEFAADSCYYEWGKQQRLDPATAEKAVTDYRDSGTEYFEKYFSQAFGREISAEATPELHELLGHCVTDAHNANKRTKDHWKRTRPFVEFGESSLIPEDDEEEGATTGYPSGHTIRCYTSAIILCLINPEASEDILRSAREYSMERIICGHHYKSDVDAAMQLAVATVMKLHASPEFLEQLSRARTEHNQ